jgi:hypothetical protein
VTCDQTGHRQCRCVNVAHSPHDVDLSSIGRDAVHETVHAAVESR